MQCHCIDEGGSTVNSDLAAQLFGQLLLHAAIIAAPLLAATLLVGVLISILQVVTQVQEMSLTFIPKLVIALIVLIVAGPWMLRTAAQYASRLISDIPKFL